MPPKLSDLFRRGSGSVRYQTIKIGLDFLQKVHRGDLTALNDMIAQRHALIVGNGGTDLQVRNAVIALAHLVHGKSYIKKAIEQLARATNLSKVRLTSDMKQTLMDLANRNPGSEELTKADAAQLDADLDDTYARPIMLLDDPNFHSERFPYHAEFNDIIGVAYLLRRLTDYI